MSSLNSQEKSDGKKTTTDAKKAAANDREDGNGKATKAGKRTNPAADEKYTIGSIDTVKRGFRQYRNGPL